MTTKLLSACLASAAVFVLAGCSERPAASVAPATGAPPSGMPTDVRPAAIPRTSSPDGASVFIISPADGATVTSPVHIEFGIAGMTVTPAGDNAANSGHHHVLIDIGLPDLGLPIPTDATHIHFGDGSTATDLSLEPGEHTLQLLLGDYLHIPHLPPVASPIISIIVE